MGRMAETSIVCSREFMKHEPAPGHPEGPYRMKAILDGLESAGLLRSIRVLPPRMGTEEEARLIHEESYLELLKKACSKEIPIDADTPTRKETYRLALLAVGGALVAAEEALERGPCFALIRPPGHHASRCRGAGFCYLNNLAICVRWLLKKGARRIMIWDLDAHCGDGTEEIFYSDPNVLYVSFHQDPATLYPGTGFAWQVGRGEGEGFTVNVPLPPGSGDAEYSACVDEIFLPLLDQFKPEIMAVSMGFDAHRSDPLTQLSLTSQAFGWLAYEALRKKCFFVLEGGYSPSALSESVCNIVRAMQGEEFKRAKPKKTSVIKEVKRNLRDYWKF